MVMPVCAQEVLSGPQLATRVVLSICHNTSLALGVPSIYELPSSWGGGYSLEIAVEITTALTLGLLVWLLFALVYDDAGILVGLVPSSVTSIVTLTFRLHLHSYPVLVVIPIVVCITPPPSALGFHKFPHFLAKNCGLNLYSSKFMS